MERFRIIRSARSSPRSERGTAITEFVISLPFIISVATSVADIAMILHQYMVLTHAVYAGARQASQSVALEEGEYTTAGCLSGASNTTAHELVQQKVKEIISLNVLQVQSGSLCVITSAYGAAPPPGANPRTVRVRAEARYLSFFPAFSGFRISVDAVAPYFSS